MNKKIESIQKSIDTFREMIKQNSSSPIGIRFEGYYELTPRGRYNREHDASFKEIRETMLNNLAKKYDEKYLEKRDSFIIYVTLSGKEEDILDWKRLLEILEENKRSRGNYLKFLRDLERAGKLDQRRFYTLFTVKDLDRFLSDVLADVEDDGNVLDPAPAPTNLGKEKNTIVEKEEEEGEEKNELSESSEKGESKLLEKIKQLEEGIVEMTKTLEQMTEEKRKLLKEDKNHENTQKIKKLEEEIEKLEKKINQQKQELDEIKKNAQLSLGIIIN